MHWDTIILGCNETLSQVPQPSELQHQIPLGGTKHFESLLQFDIDLIRLQLLLSFILPVPERTEITKWSVL